MELRRLQRSWSVLPVPLGIGLIDIAEQEMSKMNPEAVENKKTTEYEDQVIVEVAEANGTESNKRISDILKGMGMSTATELWVRG